MSDYNEYQNELRRQVEESPVAGKCECGNEIRQAEIDMGVANKGECAHCVYDEVASMIGD